MSGRFATSCNGRGVSPGKAYVLGFLEHDMRPSPGALRIPEGL